MEREERVLGRLLAVEEVEAVAGAVTAPGDDGQSDSQGDAGTGCTGGDDLFGANGPLF